MPFTFSHPALVLPLNYLPRKWFSITALVVGSMMPDLEAFIRFSSNKAESHTWAALFWFCLPLGLGICYLFHQFVKLPLVYHLPPFLKNRFYKYTRYSWTLYFKKHVVTVLISLLIGGASHLLWDSFTHYDGVLLQLQPSWNRNTIVFGYSLEIVYLVQYLTTLLGLLVIVIAIWQLPVEKNIPQQKGWLPYWVLVFLIAAVVFGIRWWMMNTFKIDDVVVSALMAMVLGIGFTSLLYYNKLRQHATSKASKGF